MTQDPATSAAIVQEGKPTETIYADRVIHFGLGPSVSRLLLATEIGPNTFSPSSTLVIPTTALLDALNSINKHIYESNESKELLNQGLEAIKEQFSKL